MLVQPSKQLPIYITFAGIAGLPDIFSKELYGLTDMQLFYWTSRIARFMEAAEK